MVLGEASQDFVALYRLLLALWAAGHVPRSASGSDGGSSSSSEGMPAALEALLASGAAGGWAREQPQLRSLAAEVLAVWGCPHAPARPDFGAAFLVGGAAS